MFSVLSGSSQPCPTGSSLFLVPRVFLGPSEMILSLLLQLAHQFLFLPPFSMSWFLQLLVFPKSNAIQLLTTFHLFLPSLVVILKSLAFQVLKKWWRKHSECVVDKRNPIANTLNPSSLNKNRGSVD